MSPFTKQEARPEVQLLLGSGVAPATSAAAITGLKQFSKERKILFLGVILI